MEDHDIEFIEYNLEDLVIDLDNYSIYADSVHRIYMSIDSFLNDNYDKIEDLKRIINEKEDIYNKLIITNN
jgi:hypothetical protein